jgi:putative transcriptional regulator
VRAIRAQTGLSQDDFATAFGFTINQIKDWEQGRAAARRRARLSHHY